MLAAISAVADEVRAAHAAEEDSNMIAVRIAGVATMVALMLTLGGCATEADDTSTGALYVTYIGCRPIDCGPAPLGGHRLCADGESVDFECVADDAGACGWVQQECATAPPPGECSMTECGPAPLFDALCPDGVHDSYADRCERRADGMCGWHIVECPDETVGACTPEECGPAPSFFGLCPDGVNTTYADRCERNDDGSCGWMIVECPDTATVPAECAADSCGPAPAFDELCPDGIHDSYADRCELEADGTCGWHIVPCPASHCAVADCGPAPLSEIRCPDGSSTDWQCQANAEGECGWTYGECA